MSDGRLEGKVAVVTGGASGIGRATVHRFASENATVVVADIDSEGGEAVVNEVRDRDGEAVFVETDVTDRDDVDALFTDIEGRFGAADVLVNNAGGALEDGNVHDIDGQTWDENVDLNLKGPFVCTKRVLPKMIEDGGGAIVNVSSINGRIGLGLAAYSAAKGGLLPFTKLVATQYGRYGIRANAVCPGEIATDVHEYSTAPEEVRREWIDQFPQGRFGEPEEVASVVLFLASDEASYVNGTSVTVDGGMTAGRNQRLQDVTYDIGELATDSPLFEDSNGSALSRE